MSGQLSVYLLMGCYMKYAEYLWSILIKTESSEGDKRRSCYTEWTKSEREKKNHLLYLVAQLCPTLCDTMDCSPPVSSVHGDSFQEEYWSELSCPPPGDLPNPGIKPRSPALQSDSLLSKPPGKLKNTRVGSLSLLQGIFPTQEPNRDVLHCRQILYQLKY